MLHLVKEAIVHIEKTGVLPSDISVKLIDAHWSELNLQNRKHLASGFASLVNDKIHNDRSRIQKLHDESDCPFTTHRGNMRKMLSCVSHLIGKPKEFEERKKLNAQAKLNIKEAYEKSCKVMSAIMLTGADHTMKNLYEFTQKDCVKWITESKSKQKAWTSRTDFFIEMKKKLKHISCVKCLSRQDICELAFHAKEIWK